MNVRKSQMTSAEKKFLEIYVKTCDSLKALNTAYPKSLKWTERSQYAQVNKILKRPRMSQALKRHNEAEAEALKDSTLLNKRKILNEIIRQYSEASENGASERTNSVALLKLLAQISKLLDNGGGSTNLQVNIQNNAITAQVSDYLNL